MKPRYPLPKALRWAALNAGIAGMAYAGLTFNNPIVNVAVILIWLNTIILFIACCAYTSEKVTTDKDFLKTRRSVPAWVSLSFDIGLALLLGWHGWTFTAVAVFFQISLEKMLFDKADELRKAAASPLNQA